MFEVRLMDKDGLETIHYFDEPSPAAQFNDEKELWKAQINCVAGYCVEAEPAPIMAMISLPKEKWIEKMLDEHTEDCIEAARLFATCCGITFETKTVAAKRASPIDEPAPTVESVMIEMIESQINLTLDGRPELPALNKVLASHGIETIDPAKRDELFDKIKAN